MRSIVATLTAISLLGASTASAAAGPAAPARESSPVIETEGTSGNSTWLWIVGGAVALVVLFLVIDDDDEPESP